MSERTPRFDLSDNQLYAVVWMCIASFLIVLVLAIFHYFGAKDRRVADMVANGANPLDARCAVAPTSSQGCLVRLAYRSGDADD